MYNGRFLHLCFYIIIIRTFDQSLANGNDTGKCKEVILGWSKCCADWKWDPESNTCKICSPGYMGINCSEQCPKGFHGRGCIYSCTKHCEAEVCHHVTGACSMIGTVTKSMEKNTEYSKSSIFGVSSEAAPHTSSVITFETENLKKSKPKELNAIIIGVGSLTVFIFLSMIAFHIIKFLRQVPGSVNANEMTTFSNYEEINERHMLREGTVTEVGGHTIAQ